MIIGSNAFDFLRNCKQTKVIAAPFFASNSTVRKDH